MITFFIYLPEWKSLLLIGIYNSLTSSGNLIFMFYYYNKFVKLHKTRKTDYFFGFPVFYKIKYIYT